MISGISSSINSLYTYQNSINQLRLQQAISKNPEYQSVFDQVNSWSQTSSAANSEYRSFSLDFLQDYSSTMSGVMQAANTLRRENSAGVSKSLTAASSDDSVADISKRYTLRQEDSFTLRVSQLAAEQKNASKNVNASEAAKENMNFTISGKNGAFSFNIQAKEANGASKSNLAMLQEAASAINNSGAGVTATVAQTEDGQASLSLQSDETGADAAFEVNGQLGVAEGLETASQEAANAQYSVTKNGTTTDYTATSNEVQLDYGRLQATLKDMGSTEISVAPDTENIISAVSDLVDSYNKAANFLEGNTSHGRGVSNQLNNFERSVASSEIMDRLGISTNESGDLVLNEDALRNSLTEDPELTRELISGSNGLAENLYDRASGAMSANSASLISSDLESIDNSFVSNPYEYMNLYSRSGAFTLNNYSAVGVMMNYLA